VSRSWNAGFGIFRVSKYEDYQCHAAECLLLAKTARDGINRAVLLEMAQAWNELAEKEQASENAPNGRWRK
jgi:hypothetical protein